ncbi:UDP-N-acetylglucosamine 2-epimerase (non-hydrolyzing) [Vagococcus sp. PNs007]|uniref:UDP-N-acetylglucosamine 2-epimerase (non-hydrolyzing) n=1 Tax=Vagococcus proximus TaxID=2991417 RepID=A0ABT5X0B6_9ENTE|nr:UDP-N-acetylglucosamine 2-epimerase (non-hydrolyzing) [Vagococcus proximus]MDF0479344.1 UDP-N-acetylglucosamine 2-epimerase (non-hydrolyzing) [Vagococcus proximus]
MKKIKIMTVFGTRPEAIKMAPLVLEIEKQSDKFESVVVVTAQHRQMLDQVLDIFKIKPDYDLDIMKPNQTLAEITSNVLTKLDEVIKEVAPDIILVHGDTTTAYAGAMAGFYNQVPIGHVEAGLRTWDKYSPFPEEVNRQMIDVVTDLYFAPTEETKMNLLKENYKENNIFVTGNTVIDALSETVQENYENEILDAVSKDRKLILMTMHRRENLGKPMENVFKAVREILDEKEDLELIYPVHLNPKVQEAATKYLGEHDRIHLIEPLDVIDFHNFASRSHLILTDSGGIQEEAPSLGVPVLVLRDTTERPEGVAAGTLKLVGTEYKDVKKEVNDLLLDEKLYTTMCKAENPYGDGNASKYILKAIHNYFIK